MSGEQKELEWGDRFSVEVEGWLGDWENKTDAQRKTRLKLDYKITMDGTPYLEKVSELT